MSQPSILPAGMHFEGSLEGEGDLVIYGAVTGPIRIDGALWIEEGATVRGHVQARVVTVRGILKGDAYGEEAVRVGPSARLIGDLTAPRVQVVPGARFRGRVHVQSPSVPLLDQYDPTKHTLAGQEAPQVGAPIGPPTMVGAPAPTLDDHAPTMELPAVPSAPPVPTGLPAELTGALPAVPEDIRDSESPRLTIPIPRPPAPVDTAPLPPPFQEPVRVDETPRKAAPRGPLRMPTLGRTRGRRRNEPS